MKEIEIEDKNKMTLKEFVNGNWEYNFWERCTLLHLAVLKGDLNLVKKAIELGAEVNNSSYLGRSPLCLAYNLDIAKELINAGADPNVITGGNNIPVTYMYKNNHLPLNYYKCNICNADMNAKTTQRSVKIGLNDSFFQFLTAVELKSDYTEHFKIQIEKIFKYMNTEEIELQKNQKKREKELNERLDKLERRYAFGDLEDKNLYEKFKTEIETELGRIARKNVNVSGDLSNHLKSMENVALVSQNLSKHWTMGNYPVKDKIQRAVFPEGIVINPEKREYLTKNINLMMLIRPRESRDTGGHKIKKAGEKTGLSCQVAGAGLEPTTFGL